MVQDERLGRGSRPGLRGASCTLAANVPSSVPPDQGTLPSSCRKLPVCRGPVRASHRRVPDSFVAPSAWENLGDTRRTKGDLIAAADCYREALRLGPLRHVWGSAGLSLAEVLIEMGGKEAAEEALQVLRDELPRLTFNSSRFRWETALAILSERLGEIETSKRAARRALDLIDAAPQFPRHGRDVGVATATPEQRDALLRLSDQ